MNVTSVRWEGIVDRETAYHVERHSSLPRVSPLHTHDFAEVFWVDEGQAMHEADDRLLPVGEGDVVLVKPEDVHRFRSPSPAFSITNVAFPRRILADLRRRYFALGAFPWDGDTVARTAHPPTLHVARLQELGAAMASGPRNRLQLDRFLVELLVSLQTPIPVGSRTPPWLHTALVAWQQDPDAMTDGVAGLAMLAGRSREHVSRVIKETTGRRATDVLNQLRLDAAAAELRMTDKPIALIAANVGLPNLSHFYRIFGQQFGTTPRRFRLRHQQVIAPAAGR